jgi:NAD+ kinase
MPKTAPKAAPKFTKIAFVASPTEEARLSAERLKARYGHVAETDAEVIVALGGDGLMLETLHRHMGKRIPIYGMNRGSVGFLMNDYQEDDLHARLTQAEVNTIHPLRARTRQLGGAVQEALAINEVSLLRQTHQAAKLRLSVDGTVRMEELNCDGVLLATPAGSTAYNFSAYGPILPITAQLLALTPLNPFRPRRWRGALLPNSAHLQIEVLEAEKRPISATADNTEVRDIVEVAIRQANDIDLLMMFDAGHALDERILSEQFRY